MAEGYFYLGPGIVHPRASLRILTRANKVVQTRNVTWEAPSVVKASPPQLWLPSSSELGGAPELEEASEPGGMDDFDSAQPTPLPLLGRGISHQRHAASPAASEGQYGQGERGSVGGDSLPTPGDVNAP